MCANNSSYPIKGIEKIQLVAANGSTFVLLDVLFVPGIRKNLLSVCALARSGLVVKFVDDKCTVHDLRDGDNVVASGSVCHGLYRLDAYEKCAHKAACTIFDMQAISNVKLWHAHFGNLNFSSLLRLHKSDMVSLLPYIGSGECEHI